MQTVGSALADHDIIVVLSEIDEERLHSVRKGPRHYRVVFASLFSAGAICMLAINAIFWLQERSRRPRETRERLPAYVCRLLGGDVNAVHHLGFVTLIRSNPSRVRCM